jgi:hypothetical protein
MRNHVGSTEKKNLSGFAGFTSFAADITDPDYKSFLESLNAPATKPALEVSGMLIRLHLI